MTSNTVRIVIISTLFAISFSPSHARIKCWKNSDGIRECGNTIPPEYSQQNTKEMNNHGVTTTKSGRAKTKEELDEEDRHAALEHDKQLVIQKQNESNQLLLNTFASSDDIILAREGKLSSLSSEISLRQTHIVKLQNNLDKIVAAAADMERRGDKPTEKILNDIRSVKSQISENKHYIKSKQQEQEKVKVKYDEDLIRYNKLRAQTDYQASAD